MDTSKSSTRSRCSNLFCLWRKRAKRKNHMNYAGIFQTTQAGTYSEVPQPSSSKNRFPSHFLSRKLAKETNERSPQWMRRFVRFTLQEIKEATSYFTSIISKGNFSTVYKGFVRGRTYEGMVAIKSFSSNPDLFLTEMALLSSLNHRNIISPIGYCDDPSESDKFVVFEYLPHGSLYDQLHSESNHSQHILLSWKKRLEICVEVARGLDYMHTAANFPVIHRDIKTRNILLDRNLIAKILDFAHSKFVTPNFSGSDSPVFTRVIGTIGYIDPEYISTSYLTMKSDVYSFGVVLFEVLSARKPMELVERVNLIQWCKERVENGRLDEIIDPCMEDEIAPDCLKAYADTAYKCLEKRGNERPTMADVLRRLEQILFLQECTEAGKPFSPSWPRSITPPPIRFEAKTQDTLTLTSGVPMTASISLDHDSDIETNPFEEKMKPCLSPSLRRTTLDEAEESASRREKESETASLDPSQSPESQFFPWLRGTPLDVDEETVSGRENESETASPDPSQSPEPHLSPSLMRTTLDVAEESVLRRDSDSKTASLDPSQCPESQINVNQSFEPTVEVGASTTSSQSFTTCIPAPLRIDEILHSDEVTEGPYQSNFFSEPEEDAKTTVQRTVLKITKLLYNDTVRRIGVHGIAGVGKTTVLKALINYPQIKDLFDFIIWVTVSKYWSVRKIQDEVLRQLSMKVQISSFFMNDSEIGEELLQYLEDKKFLLVLDDVWERIDLERAGIPAPSLRNGCALIVATRRLEVCDDMHLIKVVEVEAVSHEEAWELFCEQVGGIVNAPGIQSFAQGIVERCGGLPLLVIVMGRALSGEENVLAWEQAFRQLSRSYIYVRDHGDIFQLLKFSFDRLKVHDIQSCFLHCALFSEDQEVGISEFLKYSIEEGLIGGSIPDAYRRGREIIAFLIHAFLLESTINDSIKMHDVVRDLALSILSQEEGRQFLCRPYPKPVNLGNHLLPGPHESPQSNRLFVPDGQQFMLRAGSGLAQPPSMEEWEKSKMIFLMDNKLSTLPEGPSCHGLLALFLQRNFRLRVIPMSFFDSMPFLKVLNLSKTRIKFLPKTISKLLNLETLILRHCERLVTLPSDIGTLKLLQVLDLKETEINMLPNEISELASLRYLDICFYGSINRSEHVQLPKGLISSWIISRLQALESLRISVCPGDERWDNCVKAIVDEVSELSGLTSLSFYFPEVELLELFLQRSTAWIDQCLTEYNIVVGHDIKRIVSRVPQNVQLDYGLMDRCLRFVNGKNMPDAVVEVLARSSAFYLDHHLDITGISTFGIHNIKKLKYCVVSECHALKAVAENGEFADVVFPCLEHLNLHYLWNLEYIWEGVLSEGSFAMLRTLQVHACPKLKFVLKSSMLLLISNLEELIVRDCTAVEKIIFDDVVTEFSCMSYANIKRFNLQYLPELDNIQEGDWPLFEYISVYSCPNFKKFNIVSEFKQTLKGITGEKDWWDSLEWKEPALSLHFEALFTPVSGTDI